MLGRANGGQDKAGLGWEVKSCCGMAWYGVVRTEWDWVGRESKWPVYGLVVSLARVGSCGLVRHSSSLSWVKIVLDCFNHIFGELVWPSSGLAYLGWAWLYNTW